MALALPASAAQSYSAKTRRSFPSWRRTASRIPRRWSTSATPSTVTRSAWPGSSGSRHPASKGGCKASVKYTSNTTVTLTLGRCQEGPAGQRGWAPRSRAASTDDSRHEWSPNSQSTPGDPATDCPFGPPTGSPRRSSADPEAARRCTAGSGAPGRQFVPTDSRPARPSSRRAWASPPDQA